MPARRVGRRPGSALPHRSIPLGLHLTYQGNWNVALLPVAFSFPQHLTTANNMSGSTVRSTYGETIA